jgi:hypothetical protein
VIAKGPQVDPLSNVRTLHTGLVQITRIWAYPYPYPYATESVRYMRAMRGDYLVNVAQTNRLPAMVLLQQVTEKRLAPAPLHLTSL